VVEKYAPGRDVRCARALRCALGHRGDGILANDSIPAKIPCRTSQSNGPLADQLLNALFGFSRSPLARWQWLVSVFFTRVREDWAVRNGPGRVV
jgi:hypothetical protein